jgi:hypothetical protein
MAKRKVKSQIHNLIPDHKKLRIDPIPLREGGVRHTVGKLSTKVTSFLETSSQSEVCTRSYKPAKLQEFQHWKISGLPFGSLVTKNHLDEGVLGRCIIYYMEEGGGFPRVRAMVNLVNLRSPMAHPNTKGAPTLC